MFKIKKNTLLAGLTAFIFAVTLCQFPPALHAQMRHNPASNHGQAQEAPHAFTGKVMAFKDGRVAIVTGKGPHGRLQGHFLDDKNAAKKFVGKKVVVDGTLKMSDNTIHVTKISPR